MNIYSYFENAYQSYPQNIALHVNDVKYTYKELYDLSADICSLIEPKEHRFVGILAHRNLLAFAGILGILRSGNAYLPLNPNFPGGRNATIASLAGLDEIIVDTGHINELAHLLSITNKKFKLIFPFKTKQNLKQPFLKGHAIIGEEHIKDLTKNQKNPGVKGGYAYMLFTSGSTGKPKGVPIRHENVQCYIDNINKTNSFLDTDRFSNTFDLTFDLSVHDMFVSWSNAAALYCIPSKSLFAPSKFIKTNKLTCWFSVPSLAAAMGRLRMLKDKNFPTLKHSFFCGEPLPVQLAEKWQKAAPNSIIKNIYGPTEATIGITQFTYNKEKIKSLNGLLSIGKVFNNNEFKVVSKDCLPVDANETGELWLAGKQVAGKYWKNTTNTKKHYTTISGKAWYKTGDLVKIDMEGDLYYIGRKDSQVKIKGYRVELSEIDYVVSQFLNNENVVTTTINNDSTGNVLIVFICLPGGKCTYNEKDIIEHCKNQLPPYMIPGYIVMLDEFPRNVNGKIDKKQLIANFAKSNL